MRALRTFIVVDIAWVLFRADTVESALYIMRKSFNFYNVGLVFNNGLYHLGLDEKNMMILLVGLLVLAIVSIMDEYKIGALDWLSAQNVIFRYCIYWGAVLLIILSVDITGQEFIYFQF